MKTIKPEFDCVLEQAATGRNSNSTLLLHNFLYIKILSLYHFYLYEQDRQYIYNVTARRFRANIVAAEKQ